jgi:hypothetical protein
VTAHLSREELVRFRDDGTAGDRDTVVLHLATCEPCSSMYAELLHAAPVTEGPAHFAAEDFVRRGYAVRGQIARSESAPRMRQWLESLWNPRVPLARAVMAAQLAVIVLLIVFGAMPRVRENSFTTLSGPQTLAKGGARLTVMFQPVATEEAVRRALLDVRGTVVAGPSEAGVFIVQVPAEPGNDAAVDAAITRLRGNKGVVRFVEREP